MGWGGEEARDATEGIYSLRGCQGEGGGRERAREAWRRGATGVASGEGGVGVREPEGRAGAEGGRPLLADQPRRGRGGWW